MFVNWCIAVSLLKFICQVYYCLYALVYISQPVQYFSFPALIPISQSFQTPHPQTSQRLQSLSCWEKGLWINNIKTLGENKGPCRMPCQLHNIRNQLARWHHNTIGNIRKLEVPGNIQWKENVIMMSLSSLALQEVVILKPSVQPAMRMSSNGDIFILCMKVLEYWDWGMGSMYWLVHGSSQYVEKLWKMLTYFHVSSKKLKIQIVKKFPLLPNIVLDKCLIAEPKNLAIQRRVSNCTCWLI